MAQNKFYRILSVAVMATVLTALLAVTAFAEITGGFGEILGLEDGKTYTAKSVTINTTGDGIAYVDADEDGNADVINLATENKDLAGLYEVTEGDNSVLVYVYGDFTGRASLGNYDLSTKKAEMVVGNVFTPGKWATNTSSNYHQTFMSYVTNGYLVARMYTGSSADQRTLWGLANSRDALIAALDKLINNNKITEAKKTSLISEFDNNVYSIYYDKTEVDGVVTYSETPNAAGVAKKAALEATAMNNNFGTTFFKYAYDASEIIPAAELLEFPVNFGTSQGSIYFTEAYGTLKFYVMLKDGSIVTRTWKSKKLEQVSGSTLINEICKVQEIPDFPKEGWIVAVEFKPWAEFGESNQVKIVVSDFAGADLGNRFTVTHAHMRFAVNNYKISKITPEAPSYTFKDNVLTWTDENAVLARTGINGVGTALELAEGATSYTFNPATDAGLWALYTPESYEYNASKPAVVYVYGTHTARADIFERYSAANGDTIAWNKLEGGIKYSTNTDSFIPGLVTGKGGWGHYSTWGVNKISTHDYHLKATNQSVMNFVAATSPEDKAKYFTEIQKILKAITVKYALANDEIIPVSLVDKYTFKLGNLNGPMTYTGQRIKVEAYIMGSNGIIETITYKAPLWNYKSSNDQTVTLDFTDSSKWEEKKIPDGYLVGFTIYPFDNFDDVNNFGMPTATDTRFVFWHIEYSIKKPVPKAPEVTCNGTVISGLDAAKTYVVVPYGINGAEPGTDNVNIKKVTGKSEVDITTLYESPVGLYGVRLQEDDYYSDSDASIIYVRGSYSERSKLHELYTSGTSTNILKTKSQATGDLGFVRGAVTRYIKNASSDSSQVYNGVTLYLNKTYPGTSSLIPETSFSYNLVKDFYEAEDKKAGFEKIQAVAKTEVYRYGLTDEEIIPINEVKKYTFGIATDSNTGGVSNFSYKDGKVRFEAYVMDKNGVINKYNYIFDSDIKFEAISKFVVDFTNNKWYAEGSETPSALPADGYFVGYVVYPYHGLDNPDNLTVGINTSVDNYTSDKARTYYFFYYGENDYVIHIPQLESPKKVTSEGTVVSGLDKDTKYIFAPYNVNGAVAADKKEISGVESFDIADYFDNPVGIYGLSVAGNKIIADSDPYVIYFKGNSTTSIVHTHEFTATSGSYKGKVVDVWDTTSTNNFAEAKWTNLSICHLANHSLHPLMLSSGNGGGNGKNYRSTEAIINALKNEVYRYQFTANEIAPLSSFVSFSYKTYLRQGSYSYKSGTVYSLFTFVVMTEDGKIEKRTVNKAVNGFSTSSVSVTLDDFADKSGYILGIEITPYGAVSEDAVIQPVAGSGTEADPCIYLTKDSYKSTDTYLQGISLILDGAIGANINFTYDADTVESAKLVFDEATGLEPIAATLKDGKGSVIVPFYPKNVNTLAYTAELVVTKKDSTESTLEVNNISVKAYIDAMQAAPETYAKWIPLINVLEVYCDYAENYFSNDAALDAVTLTEEELAFVGEKSNRDKDGSLTGVEFYSTSLVLLDTMTIRHYFVADKDFDFSGITVTGGSALAVPEIKPGAANAYVYVDVANIPAHKLDEVQSITLTKGEEALTISFSAMDYVEIIEGDTNAKLVNLAKVIAKYAYAASQIK